MRLGTLLLRDGVITLSQLEAALRAQVIYGGRLGTNLVELGFVELDALAGYLSRVLEVPLATRDHFENASSEALEALGPALADVYTAVPLGFEDHGDARVLALALAEPKNEHTIEKLATQCGYPIRAYCAPEMRLYYYLENYFHLTRKARYVRSGTAKRSPGYMDDRRRSQPTHGLAAPPSVLLMPQSEDGQSGGYVPDTPGTRLSFEETLRRIQGTRHRDAIGELLMDFAIGRCGAAVLFLLRDQNALGWRVYSVDSVGMEESVEELSLPLAGLSSLQIARDSGEPFRGPAPSAGKPAERRLWEATGTAREPSEMAVLPIRVRQRVVNLFYAHPLPGLELGDELYDQLVALAAAAGDAYGRLLDDANIAPKD